MKADEPKDMEITISSGTMVRALLIIVLFALAWFLRDILLVVLMAVVLASVIEPAVLFFVSKNVPRLFALVFIYVVGAGMITGLFYFFVPAILGDLAQFARTLPDSVELSVFQDLVPGGGSTPSLLSTVSSSATDLAQGLRDGANIVDLLQNELLKGGALHSLSVFFGGLLSIVFIVVFSFYLAAQERGIESFLRLIAPMKSRGYVVDLWKRSQKKIGLWFQGQLVLGLLVGVITFLVLSILGLSSPLLFAILIMVFELIPVFGPIMAAVPAIAVAFTEGTHPAAQAFALDPGFSAAIIIAIAYFFIQQIESQVLHPQVVRKVTGIPPVLVILALVVGAKMAGFIGVLLAVPMTAILMEFLNDVAKERKIFED
jgi:predicted PurR-regulated permease PerM